MAPPDPSSPSPMDPAGPAAEKGLRLKTDVTFAAPTAEDSAIEIDIRNLNLWYGPKQALFDISLELPEKQVTAFIGPSGCGKSTLLRSINRMNDLIDGVRIEGELLVAGANIYAPTTDVIDVRRRIGMVFQKSNPLPKTIY